MSLLRDNAKADHPNTARLIIGNDTKEIELTGISIGGGKVEIAELIGFELRLSGNHPACVKPGKEGLQIRQQAAY